MNLIEAVAQVRSHPVECACQVCKEVMDAAEAHRYGCKCDACKFWWDRVPPEDDD